MALGCGSSAKFCANYVNKNALSACGQLTVQAINIRAADAIVSRAPKPMKILPIREVLSKLVLLPLPRKAAMLNEEAGGSADTMARDSAGLLSVAVGELFSTARSMSFSSSDATTCAWGAVG